MPPDPDAFGPTLAGRCAEVGVAIVIVPASQGCPAGGGSRWVSGVKALVMAGNRAKSRDGPWFAFFRGIRRLMRHSGKMIVGEGARGLGAGLEEEAGALAGHLLTTLTYTRYGGELCRNAEATASLVREIG